MVVQVTIDMDRLVKETGRRLETLAHEVTQDLAETAIMRTPVDTGFLRGSWFTSINTLGSAPEGVKDKPGEITAGRVSLEISQARLGDTIYVLNGANYAPIVETGTSKQAPNGFVRTTVNDAPQIAERVANRIKVR